MLVLDGGDCLWLSIQRGGAGGIDSVAAGVRCAAAARVDRVRQYVRTKRIHGVHVSLRDPPGERGCNWN